MSKDKEDKIIDSYKQKLYYEPLYAPKYYEKKYAPYSSNPNRNDVEQFGGSGLKDNPITDFSKEGQKKIKDIFDGRVDTIDDKFKNITQKDIDIFLTIYMYSRDDICKSNVSMLDKIYSNAFMLFQWSGRTGGRDAGQTYRDIIKEQRPSEIKKAVVSAEWRPSDKKIIRTDIYNAYKKLLEDLPSEKYNEIIGYAKRWKLDDRRKMCSDLDELFKPLQEDVRKKAREREERFQKSSEEGERRRGRRKEAPKPKEEPKQEPKQEPKEEEKKEEEPEEEPDEPEPRGKGLKRKRTYGGGLSRDEHHRNIISAGIVRY
jgi:hypothetical protein